MMNLLYKPDWEQTKERLTSWWAHEDFGRCAIAVTAEKSGSKKDEAPPSLPQKREGWWIDLGYLRALHEYRLSHTFYGGEAVPAWNTGDGWIEIAGYLGCHVELAEETGWVDPIIAAGSLTDYDCQKIVIDPNNFWWKFAEEVHHFAAEEARGKSVPAIQALGGCADTLASIRGTQNLLLDVKDCPEYVREVDQHLMKLWIEVYEKLYQITHESAEGSITWPGTGIWAPGRFYFAMCDFSYMISPKMFCSLFLPSIEKQVNYLDYSMYHLDGEGAYRHIDAILELPKLNGVQVVPGDGKPTALHYMDLLKKIQRAGKNLQIMLPPEQVETALETLSSRGLFITTRCRTEAEARDLLKIAKKCSRDRKI